ncbi:MAG: hypothetical protein JSR72_05710 [Proteobacteria bacterium]|nr:hypothetical protein [Pseudomonadota bacterium]
MIIDHPASYGASDRLLCQQCGGDRILTRRSPHPDFGGNYEIQIFRCVQCGDETTRSVDDTGRPRG